MLPKQQENLKSTKHTSKSGPHIELSTISGGTAKGSNVPQRETTNNQEGQDSAKQLINNG